MKKIFAGIATILLALAMAAMFVSCGGSSRAAEATEAAERRKRNTASPSNR